MNSTSDNRTGGKIKLSPTARDEITNKALSEDPDRVFENYVDLRKRRGLIGAALREELFLNCPELRGISAPDLDALLDIFEREYKANGKREEQAIFTSAIAAGDVLYEEILNDGAVHFIDGTGTRHETVMVGDITYRPLTGDELTEALVLLPSGLEEYGDEAALIAELREHIHKYVDISPFFETISAYYILLTWLYDELSTLPYLRALGDTGTGKSRFLDVVGRVCYKATMVAGAVNPAPIYRLIRKWHGTIIIDEGDFRQSEETGEVVKILNCGFERGRPVVRCTVDHPDDLQVLGTFGPKIISSRRRFRDVALESRCITEIMRETSREDVLYLLPPIFYKEEARLRNKLLAFRFRNRGKVDLAKAQLLDGIDIENRLKQATASFVVLLAHNEQIFKEFIAFLTAYNAELVEERSETVEGGIISALNELVTSAPPPVSDVPLVPNVPEFTVSDVCAIFNERRKYELNPRTAGKIIKTLGFTSVLKKTASGKKERVLVIDCQHLARLKKKYLPPESEDENNGNKRNKRNDIKGGRNVCDGCGYDRPTTLHEGRQLCDDCLREHRDTIDPSSAELRALILSYVQQFATEDITGTGAYVEAVAGRISRDRPEHSMAQTRAAIDELLKDGTLTRVITQHGLHVKLAPGVCVCGFSCADDAAFARHAAYCERFQEQQDREALLQRGHEAQEVAT